jgi:Domain of unknown function (DUF3854)
MSSYPNTGSRTLSDAHRRMLYDESGIDPGVAAQRGYYTARLRSEVPETFRHYQRRRGLVVPMFSPDGETVGYQLRPDKPRNGGPKYETPGGISPVVDVHPRMREEARHGDGPLLITEGAKTGDAATSEGMPAVVLPGVWMWCVPKVKPYRLKPCFDHIRLEGRPVFVAFDSDCMSKANVQDSLAALVPALEERGASVKVIYLPDAPDGSKQGVDDYLAAGGTVREMFALAQEFDPADIGRIRMSRDERLRAAVEDLERRWWAEEWKGRGGHSDRDIALKLIEAAARCGKIHADGLRVKVSWGVLQVEAKVARRTLAKALSRLEERGFLYRDNEGRKPDKTGAFVLCANVDQEGRGAAPEGNVTQELQTCDPGGLHLRGAPEVPRLRWSRPKWKPGRETRRKYRLGEISRLPEPRARIERLGKIRGAVVDALWIAEGHLTLQQLCEVLHRKRTRDVRRRVLPPLETAGVIKVEGNVVRLAADWSERLGAVRRIDGELEADELAERRRKLNSRAYHRRHETPKSEPSAAGFEAIRRNHEQRRAGLVAIAERAAAAAKPEELRKAEAFVRDRLWELGRIRLALLQDIWHDEGGDPWTIPQAIEALGCHVEELLEFDNRKFVFPPAEGAA